MKSLNQIIAELQAFATAHYQIHTFGHGDVWEISPKSDSIVYPLLWMVPQSATPSLREVTQTFTLLCMDLVDSGEKNETEVLSDTQQIILDVCSYYRQQHSQSYIIDFGGTVTPFTEAYPERVSGNSIVITIRQPFDYNECAIPASSVPVPPIPSCDPATWILENTGGTQLSTGTIGSGLSDTITAPDATWTLFQQISGNTISTGSIESGDSENIFAPNAVVLRDGSFYANVDSGDTIDVPSAPTPCADAIVELNGVEMATIPSGDTENIEVRQSSGATLVGSKQGQHWRVGDSDIDINGTPVASVKAEDSLSIDVTQSGSPVGSWNGSEWIIPPPTINKTGMPWKTGQTVSYYAGDDGDLQLGRGADFFTLEENNYFGNTARFTDTLGGSTYANDIVIDWSTHEQDTGDVIGWYRAVVNAGTNWTSAFDNAPASVDGFAGWRVPNYHEIERVYYTEVRGITYAPFNVAAGFSLWCSTTYPTDTTRAWVWLHNAIIPNRADPKTSLYRVMYCRTFNTSEL